MDREVLYRLIRESTSLKKVKELLRRKALPHTAKNWDDLIDRRLRLHVETGALPEKDLVDLLFETEEHGRQHVFLFELVDGAPSLDGKRLRSKLEKKGISHLIDSPVVLDRPDEFVATGVRISNDGEKFNALIKFTGRHIYRERIGETTSSSDTAHVSILFVEYRVVVDRSTWVAELHADGLLELRIQSKKNSSMYKEEVGLFWELLKGLLMRKDYNPLDLTRAKKAMWRDRSRLEDELSFVSLRLQNSLGSKTTTHAGTIDQDLHEDVGADQCIDAFLEKNDAYCDSLNVWFLEDSSTKLTSHTHVVLSGEVNEYALPANCIKQEHDYIRDRIRRLNR